MFTIFIWRYGVEDFTNRGRLTNLGFTADDISCRFISRAWRFFFGQSISQCVEMATTRWSSRWYAIRHDFRLSSFMAVHLMPSIFIDDNYFIFERRHRNNDNETLSSRHHVTLCADVLAIHRDAHNYAHHHDWWIFQFQNDRRRVSFRAYLRTPPLVESNNETSNSTNKMRLSLTADFATIFEESIWIRHRSRMNWSIPNTGVRL